MTINTGKTLNWVASTALLLLVTLLTTLTTMAFNSPSRSEVSEMIAKEAPYIEDRKYIISRLDTLLTEQKDMSGSIKEIKTLISKLVNK